MNKTYSSSESKLRSLPRVTRDTRRSIDSAQNREERTERRPSSARTLGTADPNTQHLTTNTVLIRKHIESLNHQHALVEAQTNTVAQEIKDLRVEKNQLEKRNKMSNRVRPTTVRQGRVDQHKEKNKKLEREIDGVRRQITTLTGLNSKIKQELDNADQDLKQEVALAAQLDTQLAEKTKQNQLKTRNQRHQEANAIKGYHALLVGLERQLNQNPKPQVETKPFYMTELAREEVPRQIDIRQSRKNSARAGGIVATIRDKIKQISERGGELANKTGTKSMSEAAGRLSEAYTEQYEHYFYLMQRYELMEQLKQQNTELATLKKKQEKERIQVVADNEKQEKDKEQIGFECEQLRQKIQNLKESERSAIQFVKEVSRRLPGLIPQQSTDFKPQNLAKVLALIPVCKPPVAKQLLHPNCSSTHKWSTASHVEQRQRLLSREEMIQASREALTRRVKPIR